VHRSIFLASAAAVFALGSAANAQQAAPKPVTRAELVAKLDSGFRDMDSNHDGVLSANEVQALQSKQLQELQVQARTKLQTQFKQLDTNKDGQLSFAEFAAVATVKANQTPAQLIQQFDTNKDGKISADEFRNPRVAAFNKVDANHDGTVTPEELRAAQGKR
jgi:Ca2+-binding EF-hand superfamily protein